MESSYGTDAAVASPADRWRKLGVEFSQYVVVGGVAFLVDVFLLTRSIAWWGFDYRLATALGFVTGLVCNYALCVLWVWRGTQARTLRDFVLFTTIGAAGLGLTELGMWIGVGLAGFSPTPVKFVVAIVVLFWNFVLRRFLVFNR